MPHKLNASAFTYKPPLSLHLKTLHSSASREQPDPPSVIGEEGDYPILDVLSDSYVPFDRPDIVGRVATYDSVDSNDVCDGKLGPLTTMDEIVNYKR